MKKLFTTLLLSAVFTAYAQPNHLVISQVYADGGNTGAFYAYDFVELYNPTSATVSLSDWSLQYAGATSKNWNSNQVNLSGSVAPGKYFLIQLNGGAEGRTLPAPDLVSSNITMSAAGGKVALRNNTITLQVNCPLPDATIVDLVGWSGKSKADCAENTPIKTPTDYPGSISRVNNGCTDTDNNSADFALTTPSPRNSSSNGHTCNSGSIAVTVVSPNLFCVDADHSAAGAVNFTTTGTFSNSILKAVLSDAAGSFGYSTIVGTTSVNGTNPSGTINITIPANTASGTGYRIRIEATSPLLTSSNQSDAVEIINGAKNLLPNEFSSAANNTTITLTWKNPTGCFDEILIVAKEGSSISGTPSGDGSAYTADLNFNGNGTPFDGGKVVYKGTASGQTVTNLTVGATYYFKAYTRRGTTWSSGTEINDKARVVPLPGEIVINQLNPQYTSGVASDEYIELVNLTDKSFDMKDVAIRIKNGAGTEVPAGGTLSGTIQPHSYWLLTTGESNTITVGQSNSIIRDGKVDVGLSATAAQVALVRTTDNTILDGIGYGTISTPVYVEGTAAAKPTIPNGLKRKVSGTDNNTNRSDFMEVANADIDLRNSSSRLANAGATIPAGDYTTLEVTGKASLSGNVTFSNKTVLTNGMFMLNNNTLTTAKATEGTAIKYIKTNGTGMLTITNVGATAFFPVGNSTYNPVTISNGSNLSWSVNVADALAPNPAFNREYAVQRTWNITPAAAPPAGATVVFEYDENDAAQTGPHFDKTKKVQVWSYHNGIWQPVTDPQMPATTASGRKAVTLAGYTRFSPFVIVNANAPLPVHFTGFSVRAQSGGVQLQFTNASERDVAYYVVERSANGQLFETRMQLEPVYNNGSTATYRWLDAAPLAGEAWYRVTGVDKDGTIRQTPALKINTGRNIKALTVYPSPVQGRTLAWQATLPGGAYELQVVNSTGQAVLRQRFACSGGNYTETLALPAALAPGVYRLQISNGAFAQQQSFTVLW